MGEYPSLCVRNMHAVRMQCKNFPYVFFTVLGIGCAGGGGGGLPRDWYTTCRCRFSPRAAQKSKFPKTFFFDTVIT